MRVLSALQRAILARLPANDPFRDRNVALLFGAQGISSLGSQVSHIAFPLIAVDVIRASNGAIALMEGAFLLPFVLFGLPVGTLVDRRARRPVMVAMDLLRMGALLVVPIAAALGALHMSLLYCVLFVIGTGTLIYDVANQSYLPALLRGDGLSQANGRLMVIESATGVVGPSLAGVAVGRLGGPLAIVVDSVSYLISAVMLRSVLHREDSAAPATNAVDVDRPLATGFFGEMREGLRWVLSHPHLRGNAAAALLFNFFGGIASGPLLIAYARRELQLPAEAIGFILGGGIVGLVIGSAVAGSIASRFGVGRTIIVGGFILPTMPLGFALIDASMGAPTITIFAVLAQVVAFFGAALFHVNQVTYRQLVTPHRLLGRMNASMKWLMLLGMPLGALAGSLIADGAGLRAALFVGAAGVVIAPIPLLLSGIASVVRQPHAGDAVER